MIIITPSTIKGTIVMARVQPVKKLKQTNITKVHIQQQKTIWDSLPQIPATLSAGQSVYRNEWT